MNCSRATGSFGFPRDRVTQGIVNFENSRRVSKRFESAAILRRQLLTGDSQKFPSGKIEKNGAGFWQVVEIFDAMIYFDLAAEFAQITGERVRNFLRATAGNRPAHRVSRKPENQCER